MADVDNNGVVTNQILRGNIYIQQQNINDGSKAIETTFGKESRAGTDPFKMLLEGKEDNDLFPINTLEKVVCSFFSRAEDVKKIEEFMKPARKLGDPLKMFVLFGLGGSGKSMTALAFAHKVREQGAYDAIFWIGSETAAQVDQTFMKIAVKFNLPVEEIKKDPDALKLRIKTWLEKTTKRWLMIFDNVDDADLVLENAPSFNGCILITTRFKEIVHEVQAEGLHELSPLDANQSFTMFHGLCQKWNISSSAGQQVDETSQIEMFLQELDGLPIAIEQMAAYASFNKKSIKELHKEFNRSYQRIIVGIQTSKKSGTGDKASDSSTMSLATVWDLQFREIRGTVAGQLLGLISLLSADSIPRNLFMPNDDGDEESEEISQMVFSGIKDDLIHPMTDSPEYAIADALDQLNHLALINWMPGCLSVHRLVQKAFLHPKVDTVTEHIAHRRPHLEPLGREAFQRLLHTACKALDYRFPRADKGGQSHWGKWETCAMYMPHVYSVKKHFEQLVKRSTSKSIQFKMPTELKDLVQNCSWYQYELGDYMRCLELAKFGQMYSPKNSDEYAHFCSHAACAYFELHEVAKGQEQIDIAISIREKTLDEYNTQLANAYGNKTILEYSAGRYEEARTFLDKSLRIRQYTKDNYLPVMYLHRGIINVLLGNSGAGEEDLQILGDLCRKGGKSTDFLRPYHLFWMANLALLQDDLETAQTYLKEGRQIIARDTPTSILGSAYEYKLGVADFRSGSFDLAIKHFEDSIELATRRGPECETARALRMKALALEKKGNLTGPEHMEAQKAFKAAEELVKIFENREGWDLSKYSEDDKYSMMVCGQRR